MFPPVKQFGRLAVPVIVILLVGACASPATREGMTPNVQSYSKQHPYTVKVQTDGGSEPQMLNSITNEDLRASVEGSIIRSKLFKGVVQGKGGDFDLHVNIISLSSKYVGLAVATDLEAIWTLTRVSDRVAVKKRAITSTGIATFGEAVVGVTRHRIAAERSAEDNIRQGLKLVAETSL